MAASNTCVNMFHQSVLLSHQRDQLSLFFFYLLNAEISFSPGQSENRERGNDCFCSLHFILVSQMELFFFPFFAEQTIKYMLQFTFKCFKNIRETLEQDCGFNSLLSELLSFTSFHHRVSIHERFTAEQWQESRNKIRSKTVSSQ